MSTATRWILGILWILAGIGLGITAVFSGGIMTIGCLQTPPAYSYYLLLIGGLVTVVGAIAPAVILIRQLSARSVILAFVLGTILSCGLYAGYFASLQSSC